MNADFKGACEDWHLALDKGLATAQAFIDNQCTKK
jgi:hypothetical protein